MRDKKALALIAIFVMLLFVSSCGDKSGTENITMQDTASAVNSDTQTTVSDEKIDDIDEVLRLANIVLESVEFPQTVELTDKEIITDTIGLNLDNAEEYCIMQQMMSVNLAEIIIIKPAEGKMDEVLSELEARKQALINTYAFYPNQVASAEATVVGNEGEYAYLICHEEAVKAEEALLTEI